MERDNINFSLELDPEAVLRAYKLSDKPSLASVARTMGISRQRLDQIIHGRNGLYRVSPNTLWRLARALQVPPGRLLSQSGRAALARLLDTGEVPVDQEQAS